MFKILIDKKAAKQILLLPGEIQTRIYDKLELARTNPLGYFERLKNRSDYKLRIGQYRVIADIDTGKTTISITQANHRKRIYKNL